ncbi:related to MFS transporter [Cephalotrichum gorgonifer]|uniref:Related to MFS transporter n=1 Tax=Cephalotrichum gorgonifer TaxID=2041049 RepID=A0AAE8N807_9PEZI|nr:related to MFS transporter [Cephalotrichum gorgonifer]
MHSPSKDVGESGVSPPPKHHGLSLLPPPSDNPRDPLRWPKRTKIAALVVSALTNFTVNFAGSGLSVAIPVLQMQYQKSASEVNALLTFNFLLLGVGNLIWVPLAVKFGKRFSMITSTALHFAALTWTANVDGFSSLLAARCLSGFAGSAGESIVPGTVSDIFFLHERATMMSGYTILISGSSAMGPLIASFVVQYSTGGWIDFAWVCMALSGLNLVLLWLFYPESNFHRPEAEVTGEVSEVAPVAQKPTTLELDSIEANNSGVERIVTVDTVPTKWMNVWTSLITVDGSVNILKVGFRPLVLLLCPDVLFATFLYGTALASQIILIFAFPNFLLAPPYLFSVVGVGLMQVAALVGFVTACFAGGYLADVLTARMIKRHDGAVFPEQRLASLIPGCFIAPAGCIIIAFACSRNLHWVAIAFGFGMVSFGTVYAPNIAVTYVVESRPKHASEAIVIINVAKNLVAFLFLYVAVDWVAARGWIEVYMIMFMLVALSMLFAIPLYFFGRKLSAWSSRFDRFL